MNSKDMNSNAVSGTARGGARSMPRSRAHSQRHQRGVGMLGLIFILVVIFTCAALIITLTPHYITHYAIIDGLEKMDRTSLNKPKFKLYGEVKDKVFDVNNVYDDKPEALMKIDKDRNQVVFHVDYRRDEVIAGNFGVFLHFKEDVVRRL